MINNFKFLENQNLNESQKGEVVLKVLKTIKTYKNSKDEKLASVRKQDVTY